jgi:predicted transcriptional regulator
LRTVTAAFDSFLDAYALIETELRRRANADRQDSLAGIIKRLARDDRLVRRYQDDLLTYHELRNVVVHERRDGRPIAEPLPTAVEELQRIGSVLTNPPRLDSHFQGDVTTCGQKDTIGSVAKLMWHGNFSQVPVLEADRVHALLTAETIARWYAATLDVDYVADDSVGEALPHTEDPRHLQLLGRHSTVIDALAVFDEALQAGYSVDAIVITHSGSATDSPIGIVTPFDIPRLHAAL